uniref:Uncharacterized protein isoform X4 n=1 Tax=Nicotiana tabacum TaxID=4097 RepID=A0A1S4B3Q1_TOBAC|nr:PREDICTED: uncharacterized protein LOC107804101 isoform X4 [Nicotiana tabacum]
MCICMLISKGKSRKQMSSIVGQVIHYTAANVGVFTAFLRYTDIYFCEGKLCSNKSLVASALRIKEEVKENEGCDRIDLIIDDGRGNIQKL